MFAQTSVQPWAVPAVEVIEVDPLNSVGHRLNAEEQLDMDQSETETLCERPVKSEDENPTV